MGRCKRLPLELSGSRVEMTGTAETAGGRPLQPELREKCRRCFSWDAGPPDQCLAPWKAGCCPPQQTPENLILVSVGCPSSMEQAVQLPC